MQRPTLNSFRSRWPAEAMGICSADPQVAVYANDAQDRLLMDPMCPDEGWWGGWISMALTGNASNGEAYVTVPREICRLINIAVCQQPIRIRNGFYEYLQFGSGLQPKTCGNTCQGVFQAYERDSVYTLSPLLSTAQTIRVYPTDARDAGRKILIQGKDANGQIILTTDPGTARTAPGEYLTLEFPFKDTANTFSTISGLQKDETWGPVQFFQVDPTTGVEVALSAMEPTEKAANYRRYFINGIPNINACCLAGTTFQLSAMGRLDFIPVKNETDYLCIPNEAALIEECISIRMSRMDSTSAAQQSIVHHGRALALLIGQLDKFQGKVNTAIRVPIFGSDRLHRQPV